MFIGHYAPAAALKSAAPNVPLWHFFVAVQFLDYLWAIFILGGLEKARVTPGFLAASPLDLYQMPYTHSLAAALAWSIVAGTAYAALINRKAGAAGGGAIGLGVFSHWVADFLVHAKDLALYPGSSEKLGLGLWSSVPISQSLEAGLLALGFLIYAQSTEARGAIGRAAPVVAFLGLCLAQAYNLFGSPPRSIEQMAIMALVSYTAFAALAFGLDATRRPKSG